MERQGILFKASEEADERLLILDDEVTDCVVKVEKIDENNARLIITVEITNAMVLDVKETDDVQTDEAFLETHTEESGGLFVSLEAAKTLKFQGFSDEDGIVDVVLGMTAQVGKVGGPGFKLKTKPKK